MTNGDRIRQMTDEELTELIYESDACDLCVFDSPCDVDSHFKKCKDGIARWLKQEEEDAKEERMSEELLAEISLLKDKLAKAEKERDAAIADLREYCYPVCDYCKKIRKGMERCSE